MKFTNITIKNFRNFENISVDLGNKNVFFGMNDIGKTNFLYAIRYLFDRDARRYDLVDSDYHKRKTSTPIEITVSIDISENDTDTQKLRAKLKGNIGSDDTMVFIRLTAEYSEQESRGNILLSWGNEVNKLTEMKSSGSSFDIDYVFNVYYINSYVDLHDLFKKNLNSLIKKDEDKIDADKEAELAIEAKVDEINCEIAKLSGVRKFESKLTPSYKKMRNEDISITIKSDFAINYLYSNIAPYIHKDGETDEYPTQGEGRKKLVAYPVYNILAEDTTEKKINLFLIEEPETHLHRSMQSALSHFLFDSNANDNMLNYLFISTHSPLVLSDMDDVNLVRIYNSDKIVSNSEFYSVPGEWKDIKKKLNRALSEAIFADAVILVEGESECILFERVLSSIDPYYESKGIYVIAVEGVNFKPYIKVLSKLGIKYVAKTDNDITKVPKSKPNIYQTLGFSRVNSLIAELDSTPTITLPTETNLPKRATGARAKKERYNVNKSIIDSINNTYGIFLSRCDLETDLYECLGRRLSTIMGKNPVKVLKSSKQYKMVELASQLTLSDCQKIYEHKNFACLKAVRQ